MPELGTSGSVRGRDGQPPGLLDRDYYRKARLWSSLLVVFMLYCWQHSISLCRIASKKATRQEGKESVCALLPS
jgi:hypothetical protein